MKVNTGITMAMLSAAVFATEVETETEQYYGDEHYLAGYNAHIPKVGQYGNYGAYAETIYAPEEAECDHPSHDHSHGGDAGHSVEDAGRGPIKVPRRRPALIDEETKRGLINKKDEHVGKFYDWREYEPMLHDGVDPYKHCHWPEGIEDFDTPQYQSLSAKCKEELIWKKVLEDGTREKFFTGFEFESLFKQDMNHSYDVVSDTMPQGRKKVTHPVGCVSKMEFIAHPKSTYTGIFRGAKHAIQRISETVKTVPHISKTVPGHGMKFLRDGMYSANWVAMFSFDGQTSFNFFKNRWTTILREPNNICARQTIGKHLATVTDHIGATSVMDLAMWDQYGVEEAHPHWPYQIDVEPYDVYGWTDEYQNDFQDQMKEIPMNTVMYKVIAYDTPPEIGGEEILAGWLVTRSDQISSKWGDQKLFFQHRRMDDDIKRRPHYFDWLQFWPEGKFNDTPLINPAPGQKCPFFYLFEKAGLV